MRGLYSGRFIYGGKFIVFASFYFVKFRAISKYKPPGAYLYLSSIDYNARERLKDPALLFTTKHYIARKGEKLSLLERRR